MDSALQYIVASVCGFDSHPRKERRVVPRSRADETDYVRAAVNDLDHRVANIKRRITPRVRSGAEVFDSSSSPDRKHTVERLQ